MASVEAPADSILFRGTDRPLPPPSSCVSSPGPRVQWVQRLSRQEHVRERRASHQHGTRRGLCPAMASYTQGLASPMTVGEREAGRAWGHSEAGKGHARRGRASQRGKVKRHQPLQCASLRLGSPGHITRAGHPRLPGGSWRGWVGRSAPSQGPGCLALTSSHAGAVKQREQVGCPFLALPPRTLNWGHWVWGSVCGGKG